MSEYKGISGKSEKKSVGIILNVVMIVVLAGLCILSDRMYKGSGDWVRTLWYNYDFTGENKKIHKLYIGSPGCVCLSGEESVNLEEGDENCNLMDAGQSMEESYYLLWRADRRYALTSVCLGLDCSLPAYEIKENDLSCVHKTVVQRESLTEKEEGYFRKMMEYCAEKKLSLGIRIFLPEGAEELQKSGIFISQIENIVQEYKERDFSVSVDIIGSGVRQL